jgi:hypothetical protein
MHGNIVMPRRSRPPGGVMFTTSAERGYAMGPAPLTTGIAVSSIWSAGSFDAAVDKNRV